MDKLFHDPFRTQKLNCSEKAKLTTTGVAVGNQSTYKGPGFSHVNTLVNGLVYL
jgi:hypothetical protein